MSIFSWIQLVVVPRLKQDRGCLFLKYIILKYSFLMKIVLLRSVISQSGQIPHNTVNSGKSKKCMTYTSNGYNWYSFVVYISDFFYWNRIQIVKGINLDFAKYTILCKPDNHWYPVNSKVANSFWRSHSQPAGRLVWNRCSSFHSFYNMFFFRGNLEIWVPEWEKSYKKLWISSLLFYRNDFCVSRQ